jgi:hypothetical protein
MKRFLLMIATALFVAGGALATPVNDLDVVNSGAVFKLYYKGAQKNVKVAIYDASGTLVFSESIRKPGNFVRPYNFSSLPEGEYTIEVRQGDIRQIEKVSYKKGVAERYVSVRALKGPDNRFILSIPNQGEEKFSIRISDNTNAVLHDELYTVNGNFARIYKLDGVKGNVFIEVKDQKGTFTSLTY